jgi:anti-sigma regulatory factor (Ser/Thr protein kinase)
MTVPGTETVCGSSAAIPGHVATLSAVPALLPDRDLARMQEWPLRSFLELRALPSSVRTARMHARATLNEWCLAALADTTELLVSEIATNAVCASARIARQRGAGQLPMRLWLTSDRRSVLIQVWDADRLEPIPQDLGPDAECGRGLLLVQTLSAEWGYYPPDGSGRPGGKIVWARCELP